MQSKRQNLIKLCLELSVVHIFQVVFKIVGGGARLSPDSIWLKPPLVVFRQLRIVLHSGGILFNARSSTVSCSKDHHRNHYITAIWCFPFFLVFSKVVTRHEKAPLSLNFYWLVLYAFVFYSCKKLEICPPLWGLSKSIVNYSFRCLNSRSNTKMPCASDCNWTSRYLRRQERIRTGGLSKSV